MIKTSQLYAQYFVFNVKIVTDPNFNQVSHTLFELDVSKERESPQSERDSPHWLPIEQND
jgi:hypothetical protein